MGQLAFPCIVGRWNIWYNHFRKLALSPKDGHRQACNLVILLFYLHPREMHCDIITQQNNCRAMIIYNLQLHAATWINHTMLNERSQTLESTNAINKHYEFVWRELRPVEPFPFYLFSTKCSHISNSWSRLKLLERLYDSRVSIWRGQWVRIGEEC